MRKIPLCLITHFAVFCILLPSFSYAETKHAFIPAKLAVAPVIFQMSGKSGHIVMKGGNDKYISSQISSHLTHIMEEQIKKSSAFLKVAAINEQSLTSSPSVAELAQAGRDIEADVVIQCRVLDFDGTLERGFSSQMKERLGIEVIVYETSSLKRLWHEKDSIEKTQKVYVNSWDDEITEKKYLDMLAERTFSSVFGQLLEKVRVDMASYKPMASAKVAAATEEFIADVDRVPRTATEVKKDSFAVVIGIENYRDLNMAEFTVRDAKMMKEYLIRVMGFPPENVILLLDARATRGDIEGYIGTWLKKNVDRNSSVFIYYAGHGAPNPLTGEPFLIPYDGNPAFLEASALPLKKFYELLAQLPAKEVFVVMDACFSGGGGRSVMAKGGRPIAISIENPLLAEKNIVVLSAASAAQISSSYPEKKHGLFTYFFLKGLQGEADITGDKIINIEKLYNYVTPNVKKIARENNREQTPVLTPDIDLIGMRGREPLAVVR